MNTSNNKNGFSLIELTLVISIILILIVSFYFFYKKVAEQQRVNNAVSFLVDYADNVKLYSSFNIYNSDTISIYNTVNEKLKKNIPKNILIHAILPSLMTIHYETPSECVKIINGLKNTNVFEVASSVSFNDSSRHILHRRKKNILNNNEILAACSDKDENLSNPNSQLIIISWGESNL